MANRSFSASALLCASLLLASGASYACDTTMHNTLEHELTDLAALAHDGPQASLYNFRRGTCARFSDARSELEVSQFLPSDEESQGLYQVYRNQGEQPAKALAHALAFLVTEQQG